MTQADVVRTGRKFQQVLDGARDVFLRNGFEGASVDDIASVAGVSKATLYSYFPDKRQLFIEVIRTECNRMADRALEVISDNAPPREVLTTVAGQLVPFLLSDFSQRIFRICMAERDRFPELGQEFYAAGPEMGQAHLTQYFTEAVAQGALKIDDMTMAAEQFSELCKANLWLKAAFGIQSEFTQTEIDSVVANAVDTFLARYGT